MTLGVYWDGTRVGELTRVGERTREFAFRYLDGRRAISLSLPTSRASFTPSESRPFFEALLPEGVVREQVAAQLRVAASDSYGLLAELGRDCAGALQIVETERPSDAPGVRWLDPNELDELIRELPQRPLGIVASDERVRLSLAGVQRKAVLVRDQSGRFGMPLSGMPSTHILKPDLPGDDYPGIARNELFCMRLAARCGLVTAHAELVQLAGHDCLVVERFDREHSSAPASRRHQEDLCQALGLTPDFKYQRPGWEMPSYAALAGLLDRHALRPGLDRLRAAQAAVFNFLIGNADAHAKNLSLLHVEQGVQLAPAYDLVSTGAYERLSTELALSIGDELEPDRIGAGHWSDLAFDFGLGARAFERERRRLARIVPDEARRLASEARRDGWHHPAIETVLAIIARRVEQL